MIRLLPLIVIGATTAHAHGAFFVGDRSFFSGVEHTFLDFETRGDGSPIGLGFKEAAAIPPDEYAAQGIRLTAGMIWRDVGTPPSSDPNTIGGWPEAVDAVGSWPTVIGRPFEPFTIEFLTPVRAFGIGVVQRGFIGFEEPSLDTTTRITAFNADDHILGETRLWLDTIDGQFGTIYENGIYGDEWRTHPYAFLGLATEEQIARVEFEMSWQSSFDDLHFSAVPAPGAGAAFGLLGLGALARRRRR